jgi:hypothetical protein
MIYTVVWIPPALDMLAYIWTEAADRQEVTDAASRIDKALRIDAHNKGQPLDGERLYTDDPLAVTFTADAGDCMVRVLQVKRTIP